MNGGCLDKVRIGVIGCGVIGSQHVKAAAESDAIELVAIADLREDVLAEKASAHGVGTTYTEGEALLEDARVDGVVLAMPAVVRKELGLKALAAGKHLLTEKPVGMDAGEVRELISAKGDLVAGCCCSRFRFPPSAQVVTDFVATGALGDLRSIHCRALRAGGPPPQSPPPVWRLRRDLNGGGIMSNWGCYDLDYLLGVTGWSLKPTAVLGQTWGVPPTFSALADPSSNAETHLCATVLCEGGAAIHYERGEMVASTPRLSWQIVGTEGSLDLEMVAAEKTIVHHRAVAAVGVESETLWEGTEDMSVIHRGPVTDFAGAIREGRETKTSLEQALVVQAITDGIYAASERGESVGVDVEVGV